MKHYGNGCYCDAKTTLNIGLSVGNQQNALSAIAIVDRIMELNLGPRLWRVDETDEEHTLVILVNKYDKDAILSLREELGQDCIAVLRNGWHGELIGDNLEPYGGKFDLKFFKQY